MHTTKEDEDGVFSTYPLCALVLKEIYISNMFCCKCFSTT